MLSNNYNCPFGYGIMRYRFEYRPYYDEITGESDGFVIREIFHNNKLNSNPIKHKIIQENKFGFECSICYEEYKPNDQIYILKCGHDFCCKCIDNLIQTKSEIIWCYCAVCTSQYYFNYSLHCCPYCRQSIEDNNIFNTGLSSILVKNDFLLETLKSKSKLKSKLNLDFNENISKNSLLKLILFEFLINKSKTDELNINDYSEKNKKQRKNKQVKIFKKYKNLEVVNGYKKFIKINKFSNKY